MSLACEYLVPAIKNARVVIAEINEMAPASCGPHSLSRDDINFAVYTRRLPRAPSTPILSVKDLEVAAQVANLVEDDSNLQCGIGAMPEAIMAQLSDYRDLGIHS
jgi:acyl-CoA hydrolase